MGKKLPILNYPSTTTPKIQAFFSVLMNFFPSGRDRAGKRQVFFVFVLAPFPCRHYNNKLKQKKKTRDASVPIK